MRRDMKKLKRLAARLQPLEGTHPFEARRAERGKATQVVAFEEAAEAFNTCTSRNGATKSTERAPQLWKAERD